MKKDLINGDVCPICGKVGYVSEKEANRIINVIKKARNKNNTDIPKRSYWSPECGVWHLSHYLKGEF